MDTGSREENAPTQRPLLKKASLARAQDAGPQRASAIAQAKLAERDALWTMYDTLKATPAAQSQQPVPPLPQPRVRRL